jgi:hypothetical protein
MDCRVKPGNDDVEDGADGASRLSPGNDDEWNRAARS